MKDATRAGVALQNKKAEKLLATDYPNVNEHRESNLYSYCSVSFGDSVIALKKLESLSIYVVVSLIFKLG